MLFTHALDNDAAWYGGSQNGRRPPVPRPTRRTIDHKISRRRAEHLGRGRTGRQEKADGDTGDASKSAGQARHDPAKAV